VARELGREISAAEAQALQHRHGALFSELLPRRQPLPDAVELVTFLRSAKIPSGLPRLADGRRSMRRWPRSASARRP
jgi:hypothetical protein